MNRKHLAAPAGQGLAAQHAIAHANAQFAFRADMLFQRHDKSRRQRNLSQRRTV